MTSIADLRKVQHGLADLVTDHLSGLAVRKQFTELLEQFQELLPPPTIEELGWSQELVGRWAEVMVLIGHEMTYETALILRMNEDGVYLLNSDQETIVAASDEVTPLEDYQPVSLEPVHVSEANTGVNVQKPDAPSRSHPAVLMTVKDFRSAPDGTVVACDDAVALREKSLWITAGNSEPLKANNVTEFFAPATVLRWGMEVAE